MGNITEIPNGSDTQADSGWFKFLTEMYNDRTPVKDDVEASQQDFPAVQGNGFTDPLFPCATEHDAVAEQREEDFVPLDASSVPVHTQSHAGDRHPENPSDRASNADVNHDLVGSRDTGDEKVSAFLDPTDHSSNPRSIVEQAKEPFPATDSAPLEQNMPEMVLEDQCHTVDVEHVSSPGTPESWRRRLTLSNPLHPPRICAGQRKEEHSGFYTPQLRPLQIAPESWHRYSSVTYFENQFPVGDHPLRRVVSAAPNIGRTDFAYFDAARRSQICELPDEQRGEALPNPWTADTPHPTRRHASSHQHARTRSCGQFPEKDTTSPPRNVIIIGETGIGKSSIINLIAGQELARTSKNARGCIFEHTQYHIMLDDTVCTLWDTTSLDEGSEGTVPVKQAENNLKELMRDLARSGGIHLIIYCVPASRLTKALRRNYDLFYVTVCRKKVHVVLVVTGLENQEAEMDTWWTTNELTLQQRGMWFDAHACVTTANAKDNAIQERRSESQKRLRELVIEYSGRPGWKSDPSFVSRVLPLFQTVLAGVSSTATTRKLTVCGTFSELFPGTTALWEKSTGRIGSGLFQITRLDKRALDRVTPKILENVGGVGAGVLVYYTSSLEDDRISWKDAAALKTFYDVAGGQLHPVIVVLRGCDDDNVAEACSVQVDIDAHFISFPTTEAAKAKLEGMIERLCIEHVEVKIPKFFKRYLTSKRWWSA